MFSVFSTVLMLAVDKASQFFSFLTLFHSWNTLCYNK